MKRERLNVLRDVLWAIRNEPGSAKPTHVLYKSNISHQMLLGYVKIAKDLRLLDEILDPKGKKRYVITAKGCNFLEDYDKMKSIESSYGLL